MALLDAIGLTVAQVTMANMDESTRLPSYLQERVTL